MIKYLKHIYKYILGLCNSMFYTVTSLDPQFSEGFAALASWLPIIITSILYTTSEIVPVVPPWLMQSLWISGSLLRYHSLSLVLGVPKNYAEFSTLLAVHFSEKGIKTGGFLEFSFINYVPEQHHYSNKLCHHLNT